MRVSSHERKIATSGTTTRIESCAPVMRIDANSWAEPIASGKRAVAASMFGYAMRIASDSWAMPIVATSTMTRGASKSRRMMVMSSSAPYNVPTTSAASRANQNGTPYCAVNNTRRPAPTSPMPPTAKLMTRVAR